MMMLELPLDYPRRGDSSRERASCERMLPPALAAQIRTVAARLGAPVPRVELAALTVLLHRYTGEDQIDLGEGVAPDFGGNPSFAQVVGVLKADSAGTGQISFVHGGAPDKASGRELALAVTEVESGLCVTASYDAALFEMATVHRLMGHFSTLLTAAAADPNVAVGALPLLTDEERRQVKSWAGPATAYPREMSVPALFEQHALRTPERVAVVCGEHSLSYGELNRRANRLAHHLRELGVGPDGLVGICVERSLELIVGLLAILKAGGAYVPLDPTYPADRLAFMLADTAAPVLLTQSHVREKLPVGGARVVCVDQDWPAVEAGGSDANLAVGVRAEDLAYVSYTSGSTGRPKGVLVPHRAVVRLVRNNHFAELTEHDVFLQLAPVPFDASTLEIWGALLNGARLVVMPPQQPSLTELARALVAHDISVLWLTAGLFHLMVDHHLDALLHVRQVVAGGDVLSVPHVRKLLAALKPGHALINGYGPTENTTFTCCFPMTADTAFSGSVPIGRPIANTQCYVLDRHRQPVPQGVAGELYAGGDGLARGYLNLPELTAERFVETPYGRLYRTGDLVRWLPGGDIEFFGRRDNQVKIRGFRIELGEIEYHLGQHPAVSDCVVVARQEGPGDTRLVAYLTANREAGRPAAHDLRAFLTERLPAYMVPAAFVTLEQLPLNPNGKVDRKALPAPDYGGENYVAPRNEAEARLAAIWAEVLKADRVGVHDDFFLLGGHSLLATQVVSRVRQSFGVELPLPVFFAAPTVAGLAERLAGEAVAGAGARILPVERGAQLPLSFAQRRLWFFDQLTPQSPLYNIAEAIRLEGPVDGALLEESLNRLIARHESLRTNFVSEGREPLQVIHPTRTLPLPVRAAAQEEVPTLVREEARRPFDLAREMLLRATLLKLGAQEHLLLITIHHIIADGWSMGVLYAELGQIYAALQVGREPALAPLSVDYADFTQWQRSHLSGAVLEQQLAYWQGALAEAPAILELPTDKPRPALQSFRGAKIARELPVGLVEQLQHLSQREGATLFMTLLAGFQTLLHRYTGQQDLLVGAAIANRNRAETEGMIGFFVNTLPMRAEFAGSPTFRELLQQIKGRALGAFAHQDLPLERLVEAVQPERNLSHAPLFQVIFALQNAPMEDLRLEGVTATNLEPGGVDTATAKYDLVLTVEEAGGRMRAVLEYCTDLFEPATVQRLLAHYETLLAGVAADPGQPVGGLPLLTDAERATITGPWAGVQTEYPRHVAIHDLFDAQAAQTPDRIAVRFGDATLTYGALQERSNRAAHALLAAGVQPGALVGLAMQRSVEMVVGLLAILKAGAAYLPLDSDYPADRLAFMLADAEVSLILTQEHLQHLLPPAQIICLDTADFGAQPVTSPTHNVTAESPAYVMYTSGSTGRPKGVIVPHRAVVRLVKETNFAAMGPDEVFLQLAPISFDAATLEVWGPLLNGGLLVVAAPGQLTLAELADALVRHGITTLWLTAGLFHLMADAHPHALAGVRQLLAGGDVLSPSDVTRVLRLMPPDGRLINGYGPTENTTFTCCHVMAPDMALTGPVPIGRPIANTTVYVLDGNLQPVPAGVPGELCAGGDGLALGYWKRPELTAERFVETPYGRVYHTGDLVRWLPDGTIEFIGRRDHQVKIRGFRIELGEIETALAGHPAVGEVVVLAREDGAGGKQLVAYVTPSVTTPADLRAFLKAQLPDYMVPSAFVLMDALPLGPNGKVDRKALPAPRTVAAEAPAYTAPRTSVEERLADIFADVLELDRVSIHDHFFEIGGHSLLATQVVSRVRELLQRELPLRTLFERPTVAELAGVLGEGAARVEAPLIRPVERSGPLPLSFAQQRLWFLSEWEPDSPLYNIPAAYRMQGALHAEALQQSLNRIVDRHESLRTTFPGEGHQVVHAAAALPLAQVDLTHLNAALREAEALRLAGAEGRRAFDLRQGPLLRATLIRLAADDHLLMLTMHHIISDGWSMKILMDDLAACYEAYAGGTEPDLRPLPVQYADFAAWQNEWQAGEELERQAAYWRTRLAGAPTLLDLPTDRPRPPVQTFRGRRKSFAIPTELYIGLTELSRRESATLFMTLLAAWNVLLHRYSRQEEVVVGTPVAGRNRQDIEGLVGFFVNTLVLRTDLAGEPSFVEFLSRVRETALDAYAHQDCPFERLVDELQPERNLSHTPLFQVMFALQDNLLGDLQLPGLTMRLLEPDTGTAKFDLTLDMAATAAGLTATFEWASDLFDETTIDRMIGHFTTLLSAIVANPQMPVGRLVLLPDWERERQVEEWNRTGRPYPQHETVHDLVTAQAKAAPDRTALVWQTDRMTYGELHRRSNSLARHLRAVGVGPETLVGVYLERTPAMVVALLAILKAGAAYVPLDPAYPAERLGYILADSGARVVLTSRPLAGSLPETAARVLCVDQLREEADDDLEELATPENLAYVIYTSGSTGRPKGVAIEHRSVVQMLCWARDTYSPADLDGVLFSTSICFDISVFELFVTLAWGGKLIMAENALELPDLPARHEVVLINTVPSAMAELLRSGGIPDSVRVVNMAGEALSRRLADAIYALPHVEKAWDVYGPTEDTVYSTCALVERDGWRAPPIGRPLPNSVAYVLDAALQPVPIGAPGELYLGGAGLARGYLHRPDLTAERFVQTPFGRLYRTGDLARYLPDGRLEYLGRLDNQVKIRGFRIELGEIEVALARHPQVGDLVVTAREDVPGDRRLVAYLTNRGSVTVAELRAFLKDGLPDYMIPSAFVLLERLPLLPNGKVDRKALPAPDINLMETGRSYTAPRTAAEEALAAVWSQALGVSPVGIDDNYFELGGDSIRSIRVRALAAEHGVAITLQALFRHPTIRELAAVAQAVSEPKPVKTVPFDLLSPAERAGLPDGLDDAYPATLLQTGMLLHSASAAEGYRNTTAYLLRAPFDEAALVAAAHQVTGRHPILRTAFHLAGSSEILQLVHREAAMPVTVIDLREQDAAPELERFVADELRRDWNWTMPPLARLTAHRLSDDTFRLTLSFHHAILDGWSVTGLLNELLERYAAAMQGEVLPAEPVPVTFREYVALERQAIASEASQSFWREQMQGAEPTPLPFGAPAMRGTLEPQVNRYVEVAVDAGLTLQLTDLSRRAALPLKHLLLAVHLRVMGLLSGQTDVTTGVVVAGRPEVAGGDTLLGLFLNTLPFRLQMNGGTWLDLARQALAAETALLPHRRYPLAGIQQGNSPFEVYFNYTHFTPGAPVGGPAVLDVINAAYSSFALAAEFYMDATAGQLRLFLEYDSGRFAREQAELLGRYYQTAIAALTATPEAFYLAPALIPDAPLMAKWNETAREYDRSATIHSRFVAQVQRTPDAVAAICGEERVTYAELNRRANRLANRLIGMGVRGEQPVGICMERSLEMLVAMLAVLKAGGCYVPMDPHYPQERLDYMRADSGAQVVLTRQNVADVNGQPDQNPNAVAGAHNLAYIIYTSGSTGRPKGVMLEHRGVINFFAGMDERIGCGPGDVLLAVTSISFDISVLELLWTLTRGATVVIMPEVAATLRAAAVKHRASMLQCTPSLMRLVLAEPGALGDMAGLRVAMLGGEALPPALAQQLKTALSCRLVNMYGPTETTIWSTTYEVALPVGSSIPIGRPIANTQCYVLDSAGGLVPPGVAGELFIGGDGLARGYLNRAELTAERFVATAFGRLYRTGDLCRWRADGELEYLGRLDYQVKIRGRRIELGEIEARLAQHPSVQAAVVTAHDDHLGEPRLVAYLSPAGEQRPDPAELRAFCKDVLPEYMAPSAYVMLPAFPLTPNGKVDRKALPAPDGVDFAAGEREYTAPRSVTEARVAAIWAPILGVERISVNDRFLDLGGNSLMLTRILTRMREEFGVDVPLRLLFEADTVAHLASMLTPLMAQVAQVAEVKAPRPTPALDPESARQLLANLDELNEAELETLLQIIAANEEAGDS